MRYFENIELNEIRISAEYTVDKKSMMEYAKAWDPFPFHVDEEAAKTSPYGGLIASAGYTMSVGFLLLHEICGDIATVAIAGWDDVRFPHPVHAGDILYATTECETKLDSNSKPHGGIVTIKITLGNQDNKTVCSYRNTFFAAKRSPIEFYQSRHRMYL